MYVHQLKSLIYHPLFAVKNEVFFKNVVCSDRIRDVTFSSLSKPGANIGHNVALSRYPQTEMKSSLQRLGLGLTS